MPPLFFCRTDGIRSDSLLGKKRNVRKAGRDRNKMPWGRAKTKDDRKDGLSPLHRRCDKKDASDGADGKKGGGDNIKSGRKRPEKMAQTRRDKGGRKDGLTLTPSQTKARAEDGKAGGVKKPVIFLRAGRTRAQNGGHLIVLRYRHPKLFIA